MANDANKEKLKIRVLNATEEREHFHQDIELIYILEGSMDVLIADQTTHMQAEDILVINANKKHSFRASDNILFASLNIDYQLVSDIFQSVNVIFWCDSTKGANERYETLRKVLKQLLNHYLSTRGGVANFGHIALCYQVLDILSVNFLVRSADKEHIAEQDKFDERIAQINNYIRANYSQPISLKELSEKLFLSNGYLSRFFKKNYGMSFAEYLTNIRLYHAVDELLYTNTPITRIAYDCGFSNVAVFNKAFKKAYGDTPSNVRKKSKEQNAEPEQNENDVVVEERLEQFLRKDGVEPEQIVESQTVEGTYSVQNWKLANCQKNRTINIGSAADLLKSEVQEHVILLKEALGFSYVRFWNIFSQEMLIDLTRETEDYNFSKLDLILDFLLRNDIKPHIELGMKPRRLLRNVQSALIEKKEEQKEIDEDAWKRVMHAFMRHLARRYTREELDCWRLELWFDESGREQEEEIHKYFRLFNCSYEIVKKYSEKMEFGGCGFRVGFEDVAELMKEWKKQKHQPDFISMLYYPYERGEINQEKYSKRSTDDDGMIHRIGEVKTFLKEAGMDDCKFYVTEWNLTISDRNYMNDTCFKGAYIVKNLLDCYEDVDDMAYFLGSDRVTEYYDSHQMLHGGSGLIAKDSILKPAAFAFDFWNKLYPYCLGKGKNYLITTDLHDSYGIICHNQKRMNYNYYFIREDEVRKDHIWKYFEDREVLKLKLHLTDVLDGTYKIKIYRINEQCGSILNIWEEMEYESELSRNDIKYFRRACEPKLTIQKCEAKDGNIQLNIEMAANEIMFIRMRRLI